MGVAVELARSVKDALGLGLPFSIGGLKRLWRKGLTTVTVPGIGRLVVRPAESDFDVLRQVFRNGEYRIAPAEIGARIQNRYRQMLSEGVEPVIVDAGANIGAASLWFATEFPKARVLAVEPDPDNARIARLNTQSHPTIEVIEAAIGAVPGFVSLVHEGQAWAVRTEIAESGCPVITIDDAIARVPNGRPLLVKIDIEGFEENLFEANLGWLDESYAVIVEPHDWMLPGKHSSRGFQREMGKRDFEILLNGENLIYVRV